MYNRKEIEEYACNYVIPKGIKHASDMMEDMQDMMINDNPKGMFVTSCVKGDWTRAEHVADRMNTEMVKDTNMYQEWIGMVKKTPDYIRKIREQKLNQLL